MPYFTLEQEQICIAKWKPWFNAGDWTVQHFTSAESAEFKIPTVTQEIEHLTSINAAASKFIEIELKKYAKSMQFPFDGLAVRGRFMFCFDYKFKPNTSRGIWIQKADYDKYWSWHKPWFYLLIWAADQQKRYIHQIRDHIQSNYAVKDCEGSDGSIIEYYAIPESECLEADKTRDVPIKIPLEASDQESIAYIFAVNRWVESDFKSKFVVTNQDQLNAAEILRTRNPRLKLLLRKVLRVMRRRKP